MTTNEVKLKKDQQCETYDEYSEYSVNGICSKTNPLTKPPPWPIYLGNKICTVCRPTYFLDERLHKSRVAGSDGEHQCRVPVVLPRGFLAVMPVCVHGLDQEHAQVFDIFCLDRVCNPQLSGETREIKEMSTFILVIYTMHWPPLNFPLQRGRLYAWLVTTHNYVQHAMITMSINEQRTALYENMSRRFEVLMRAGSKMWMANRWWIDMLL